MTNDWKLSLGVVASGHDDARVSLRPLGRGRPPYVVVRVGAVIAHCLGPEAVGSCGQAWAAASARVAARGLGFPAHSGRGAPPPTRAGGLDVPSGSVVFDGAQPWAVTVVPGGGVRVSVGSVQVQARDRDAFDVHVRAWADAVDFATRIYPGRSVPFTRMLNNARYHDLDRGLGMWQPPEESGPERGLEL